MQVIKDFSSRALKEIHIWVWAAAVAPITALAGIFFVWAFGTETLFNIAMIIGGTIMFLVSAVWWWWIIWTVSRIIRKDIQVALEFEEARKDLIAIRILVKETLTADDK